MGRYLTDEQGRGWQVQEHPIRGEFHLQSPVLLPFLTPKSGFLFYRAFPPTCAKGYKTPSQPPLFAQHMCPGREAAYKCASAEGIV